VLQHRLGELMRWEVSALAVALIAFASDANAQGVPGRQAAQRVHDDLVAKHATAHGVPEQLIRRVITIESRGNPSVINGDNYGLMQIRLGTARAMGYQGHPAGLLDADTNMTYAVKYLAGAYRAAGCDPELAISYYQHGYAGAAKAKCAATMQLAGARSEVRTETKPETKSETKFETKSEIKSETRPADRPAIKAEREVLFAPSVANPQAEQPSAPTDTLKAKVVQTLSIQGRDSHASLQAAPPLKQGAATHRPEAAKPDAAKPDTAKPDTAKPDTPKPDTFAARADLAGVAAPIAARASLEPEPMVTRPGKKADPLPSKKRKARVERSTAEPRAVRVKQKRVRDKVEAEAKPSGDLISALKKLVAPEPKPDARKHRKQAKADARR
jgi:transglycosylase-like protein with SLT domain